MSIPESAPFRPRWLTPAEAQPYEVTISDNLPYSRNNQVTIKVRNIGMVTEVDPAFPIEAAVDELTREVKREAVRRLGLDAEARDMLHRKLYGAAHTLPTGDRAVVMGFLAETFGPDKH